MAYHKETMHNKYSINIFWSEEDDCYVATIPDFPYLSAFGDTQEEAVADAQKIIRMAIESLQRDGIPLPEPKCPKIQEYSGQVRLRMPKSLHNELALSAEGEGVSLNTHMVSLLSKNNIATFIQKDIQKQFGKLIEHQNQHFSVLRRNIKDQSNDSGSMDSNISWIDRTQKEKHQIIVH